ncbi:MAG: hypothetical protein V1720_09155 [bacterium]
MFTKNNNISKYFRNYLSTFLMLQFVVASTLSLAHLENKECCHTEKKESTCCSNMQDTGQKHCTIDDDLELGISNCGCNHSTEDAIDQFLTSEKPGYSHSISLDSNGSDLIAEKGSCSNLSYQLKFLPDSVPKYISNSAFLI